MNVLDEEFAFLSLQNTFYRVGKSGRLLESRKQIKNNLSWLPLSPKKMPRGLMVIIIIN
jgi:hypothetical protein